MKCSCRLVVISGVVVRFRLSMMFVSRWLVCVLSILLLVVVSVCVVVLVGLLMRWWIRLVSRLCSEFC